MAKAKGKTTEAKTAKVEDVTQASATDETPTAADDTAKAADATAADETKTSDTAADDSAAADGAASGDGADEAKDAADAPQHASGAPADSSTGSDDEDEAAAAQIVEPDPEEMAEVSERDLKAEVAERSVDVHTATASKHRKVFAVLTENGKLASDFDHGPNKLAAVYYLMQNGLRATDEVSFVGSTKRTDGVTLDLAYEVTAIPADLAK